MIVEKEPGPTLKFCLDCPMTILIQLFTFLYIHFDSRSLSFEY